MYVLHDGFCLFQTIILLLVV